MMAIFSSTPSAVQIRLEQMRPANSIVPLVTAWRCTRLTHAWMVDGAATILVSPSPVATNRLEKGASR